MKYRMQRDPDGAVWLLENERINMETRAYHEAAVEFWGEIERLQAVNAELLAALTEARCWIIGGVPMKNGAKCETFGEMLEMVDAAIANHNGATE